MKHDTLPVTKRKSVNLSLDASVVAAAKAAGLNLSQVSEAALREATKAEHERRWKDDNKPAMDYWNDWLEQNGVPYAESRLW